MNSKIASLLVLAAATSLARAAPPRSDNIDFPKNMEFAAEVTLLKDSGAKPGGAPLQTGHQLQLRFDEVRKSTPKLVPCELNIPRKIGQIAPGEAAVIGIKCSEVINLPRSVLGFKLVDGGREIGSGAFRP